MTAWTEYVFADGTHVVSRLNKQELAFQISKHGQLLYKRKA